MKANTEPLLPETFYHIYNRGINKEDLFKEERNYSFFLDKCNKYLSPIAQIYSWCLLKNHFHLLIRTRSEKQIREACPPKDGLTTDKVLSLQFSHLFNSYAQAVNKSFKRTGGLFETPFRRISVNDEPGLKRIVYYIHSNPLHHGFTDDFTTYPHSSYCDYLNNDSSGLDRDGGFAWFGSKEEFIKYHENPGHDDRCQEFEQRCQGLEP